MTTITKEDIISNVYYDIETGYGSVKTQLSKLRMLTPQLDYKMFRH